MNENVQRPADAGLPDWAKSIALRLDFFARRRRDRAATRELGATLSELRHAAADPNSRERLLKGFLHACLDLFVEATRDRADLAPIRPNLEALCSMAKGAINGDCDDRLLMSGENALTDLHGVAHFAARVPGRVVFLGAMVTSASEEESAAAAMLINDLCAVDDSLPLRALKAAVSSLGEPLNTAR